MSMEASEGALAGRVARPRTHSALVMASALRIHPTAIVSRRAVLGARVAVGPYATVGPGVTLGDDCEGMGHATVQGAVTAGAGCRFFPFSAVGLHPQDKKHVRNLDRAMHAGASAARLSQVVLGARVDVREHATVHGGTVADEAASEAAVTVIGDDVLLMASSHVGHDSSVGAHAVLANGVLLAVSS